MSSYVANFQVINGVNIGKLFPLKIPMTIIGETDNGVLMISKRKDGFFVSILENAANITINQQALGNHAIKLNHNDVLTIGGETLRFYLY